MLKIGRNLPFSPRDENNTMADAGWGAGGKICILTRNEIHTTMTVANSASNECKVIRSSNSIGIGRSGIDYYRTEKSNSLAVMAPPVPPPVIGNTKAYSPGDNVETSIL